MIENLKTFISVRASLETVPTNGKFKFYVKNNDSRSNYSNSSGNNSDSKYE